MEVKNTEADAYQVTINYVDENNNLLWRDSVDVKGKGYQYTLPNSFSMSAAANTDNGTVTDRDKTQWGVNYYTLASCSITDNPTNTNEAISAQSVQPVEEIPVISLEAGKFPKRPHGDGRVRIPGNHEEDQPHRDGDQRRDRRPHRQSPV